MENKVKKSVIIIGAGLASLASAALLGKKGYTVTVYDKNEMPGGRASVMVKDSPKGKFIFDKGPSWYMMPDVFEDFFSLLGENINDYLSLSLLSPSYRIFQEGDKPSYDFFADIEKNKKTFESLESGSGVVLDTFLKQTKYQYDISKNEFMYKNVDSFFDFFNKRVMTLGRELPLFTKQSTIINKLFKNELLRKVMQYQTVLLGTSPYDTPGIYTLMNYVDFGLGVWYPKGGIYEIPKALANIAQKYDVTFKMNSTVEKIIIEDGIAKGIILEGGEQHSADIVISNADYEHTEMNLIEEKYRTHSAEWWDKRTLAPSAFILYLGVDGVIPSLSHHNLFFPDLWKENFASIFKNPAWPERPAFYICAPSKSDASVAPAGTENLFVLVPIASGLDTSVVGKEDYALKILEMIEKECDIPNLRKRILVKEIYSVEDFKKDYNAFKGTALGLAHTLSQTSIMRPNNVSKKVKNLYFTGAGTNPGIGMPICLISAELVYKRIRNIKTSSPLTIEDLEM
jgi:phytoene desaturase